MKKLLHCFVWLLAGHFPSSRSFAQYTVNGSAVPISCNCYTITTETQFDSGSVWNVNKINLNNSFDFHFNVFLGCIDMSGADGIAFVLQPFSNVIGQVGEGMGFESLSPSVGIGLDTWDNTNRDDPVFDHISIQLNGVITHGNDLAGPVQASATSANIEDCQWHVLRIKWDASTKTISTYFDGQFRLQARYDLVASVFHNDPMVYWGFTGATGGGVNLQQFCAVLNPLLSMNVADTATCMGRPVLFNDKSESFSAVKDYYWDFGDGLTSTVESPPPHNYTSPGEYVVKHVITGLDGCISDTLKKTIAIGAKPVADFALYDSCTNKLLGIADNSFSTFGVITQHTWWLDGAWASADSIPALANLPAGTHQLKLQENTVYGCLSDTTTKVFSIHSTPKIGLVAHDGCRKQPISFSGLQLDHATTITQWNWKFGDGLISHDQNPVHAYSRGGLQTVYLNAFADDGCFSNDTSVQIQVEDIYVNAGSDTSVQANIPFTLGASWSGSFNGVPALNWVPSTGLNTPTGPNPTAILQNDQNYYLRATTDKGCEARDSIQVKVFNFPGVLVPNAFTPNHDGLNDILRPRYNGIKHLDYFAIYNRWGQLLFKTSDMQAGWSGEFNGTPETTQTCVWIISAEDFNGRHYQLRGTSTVIR